MNKIEKLTKEQEAKIPEYVRKWIDIGTNTDRLDPEMTRKIIDKFRTITKMPEAPLLIVENPIEAWVCCCLFENNNVAFEDLVQEMHDVFHGNPKKYKIEQASMPYQSGSFFANVFSFYDFMLEELGVEIDKDLYVNYKNWEMTSQLGCIYPLDKLTVVCQKPTVIHLNERNVLHKDGAPALECAGEGDFKIYALNGVVVPEYLVMTPEEKLDIELYNKETNADIKAEFVRKVGIERFLEKGKLMDSYENYTGAEYDWWHKSEYQLWDMASLFSGLNKAPFLKMLNQSVGIWHMEGVSPECNTLEDALKERFSGKSFIIKNIS